eukprot:1157271-Pelagomonas_calceolata.AAC.14
MSALVGKLHGWREEPMNQPLSAIKQECCASRQCCSLSMITVATTEGLWSSPIQAMLACCTYQGLPDP